MRAVAVKVSLSLLLVIAVIIIVSAGLVLQAQLMHKPDTISPEFRYALVLEEDLHRDVANIKANLVEAGIFKELPNIPHQYQLTGAFWIAIGTPDDLWVRCETSTPGRNQYCLTLMPLLPKKSPPSTFLLEEGPPAAPQILFNGTLIQIQELEVRSMRSYLWAKVIIAKKRN